MKCPYCKEKIEELRVEEEQSYISFWNEKGEFENGDYSRDENNAKVSIYCPECMKCFGSVNGGDEAKHFLSQTLKLCKKVKE